MRTIASVEQPRIDTPLSERSGMRDKSPLDHAAVLKSGEYSRSPPVVEAANNRVVTKKHVKKQLRIASESEERRQYGGSLKQRFISEKIKA